MSLLTHTEPGASTSRISMLEAYPAPRRVQSSPSPKTPGANMTCFLSSFCPSLHCSPAGSLHVRSSSSSPRAACDTKQALFSHDHTRIHTHQTKVLPIHPSSQPAVMFEDEEEEEGHGRTGARLDETFAKTTKLERNHPWRQRLVCTQR